MANKYYAKLHHPLLEAVAHGLLNFATRDQAINKILEISDTYHISRRQPKTGDEVLLWVGEYAVTPEEKAKGYCGHYARIHLRAKEDGRFTIGIEKVLMPLEEHPRKAFPHHKQPGWSQPIMRAIKRGKLFPSQEAAQSALEQLHAAFPESTVPGVGKLHAIVYEREKDSTARPVQRYLFMIEAKDGGWVIKPIKQQADRKHVPTAKDIEKETEGYFTALEQLKRQMKRKKKPKASLLQQIKEKPTPKN